MNAVENDINYLIGKELKAANEKYPLFSSVHEAYGVILEEVEEAWDAIEDITIELNRFWNFIKINGDMKYLEIVIRALRKRAIELAIEAIQIAAMCEKYEMSFNQETEVE